MTTRRIRRCATLSLACVALGIGCAKERITFVTNTQVGVRVGVDSRQIPEIVAGYNRQEAAMVPIYLQDIGHAGNDAKFETGAVVKAEINRDTKNNTVTRKDALSVLGTFKGKGKATATPAQAEASGGIAQFFATGMAAQLLAEEGGAAVISTAPNAKTKAAKAQPEGNADLRQDVQTVLKNVEVVENAKPNGMIDTNKLTKLLIAAPVNTKPGSRNPKAYSIIRGAGTNQPLANLEAELAEDNPAFVKKLAAVDPQQLNGK